MPVNCERCNKKFPDKSKFKRHLLRKTICKISKLGKDLTLKEIWNIHFKELDYDTEYKNKNCKKKKNNKPIFICNSCGKVLQHSSSYYRHINKTCEVNSQLSKMKNDIKEQTNLLCKLIDLKSKEKVIYNTTNNTQNIFNQNNINISINNFGEEDLSHINNNFLKDIIKHMNNMAVIKYIEEVHFNNPSNTNIKLLDDETKVMMIRKNNEWILDNKNLIINGMININMNRIQKAYEELEDEITDNIKKSFKDYSNKDVKKEINNIIGDTENMILNNQSNLITN